MSGLDYIWRKLTLNIHIKSTNQYESIFLKPWMSKKKRINKTDFGIFMCKYFVNIVSDDRGWDYKQCGFSARIFILQVPILQGYHAVLYAWPT